LAIMAMHSHVTIGLMLIVYPVPVFTKATYFGAVEKSFYMVRWLIYTANVQSFRVLMPANIAISTILPIHWNTSDYLDMASRPSSESSDRFHVAYVLMSTLLSIRVCDDPSLPLAKCRQLSFHVVYSFFASRVSTEITLLPLSTELFYWHGKLRRCRKDETR